MTQKARAFAPGNISCVFKIVPDTNPRFRGSLGFGFTINEGVIVEVSHKDETEVTFNNKPIDFSAVVDVLSSLTKEHIHVAITTPLPLGCGFGLSGASALATAYAVNQFLELKKSNKELAIVAHTADAANKTGLGDVTNQYFGGMLVKFKPSSAFVVEKLPLQNTPVYCAYFSPLSTKEILSDTALQQSINTSATVALETIKNLLSQKQAITFETIVALSKQFVVDAGLLNDQQTKETIAAIEKEQGVASMIVLGNSVFSTIPFPGATKYFISDQGAHLV